MWCWWKKKCTSCTSTNLPPQQVWGMFLVNDTFISCQRCDETTVIKELLNQLELCTATVWLSKHHAVDDGHDSICHRIFTCQGNTICVWKPWCFKSLIVTKTSCINDGYFCGFIFALESEHWLYCRQMMVFKLFFFHYIFGTVIFQCLNQHDLVGAQDISHLKKIVFTILSRLHEDKAYKTAYEVRGIDSLIFVKFLGSGILLWFW